MSRRRLERSLYTQIGQYGMVPLWVIERCKDDPRAIQLYGLLLAKWADRTTNRCWPDRHKDLVPAMGVAIATVDRAIATLKDIGALETKLKHRKDGAVIGMDFWIIQVDPRLTATDGNKVDSVLPITNESKAPTGLIATSDSKADASLAITNDNKDSSLPITGGGQTLTSDSQYIGTPESDNQNQEHLSAECAPTRPHTLVEDYHDGFLKAFTTDPDDPAKPDIVGGRDGKILKDLAEHIGEARLRRLLVHRADDGIVLAPGWFFRSDDPFLKSANSYTVPLLKACANRLNLSYQPPAQGPETNVWATVLERLEAKVNRHTFHTWFKPITFVSRDVHGFTLRAPSRLHIDWIEKHLVTEFCAAVEAVSVYGRATVVHFITAEDEQDARNAIIAARVQDRERLKRTVLAQLREGYPGFEASMSQDEFVKVVRAAMVRFLINLGRERHELPSSALARFLTMPETLAS